MNKIIKRSLILVGLASFVVGASAEVYTWRAAAGTTQNWTNFDWSPTSIWPTRALNLPGTNDNAYVQGISWVDDHVILDSTQVVGGLYIGQDWSTHIEPASVTITAAGSLSTDGSDGWNDGVQIGGQSPGTLTSAGTVNTTAGTTSGNLTLGARTGAGHAGGTLNLTGGSWTSAGIYFDAAVTNHIQIDGGTIQAWSIFNLDDPNQTIDITGGTLNYHSADATWFDTIVATGNLTGYGSIDNLVAVHSGTSWSVTASILPSPMESYMAWAADFNLTDTNTTAAMTADPDGDWLDNLAEYGMGGNPTNSNDGGYIPTSEMKEINGTALFTYVHFERADKADRGLSYYLERDLDLTSPAWSNSDIIPYGTNVGWNAEFNAISNAISVAVESEQFIRLRVEFQN